MRSTSRFRVHLDAKYDGILTQRIPLGNLNLAFYAVITVSIVRSEPDMVLTITSISLRDISKIDAGPESYAEYCEEAKITTGLSLIVMADYPEIQI
jgi:hypothetical protein